MVSNKNVCPFCQQLLTFQIIQMKCTFQCMSENTFKDKFKLPAPPLLSIKKEVLVRL